MKCDACDAPLMEARLGEASYAFGSARVTLANVKIQRCESCDNQVVHIPNVAGLHKALANAVANQADGPTAFRATLLDATWSASREACV